MDYSKLKRLARAQLRVGSLAFGGPLAAMAMMRAELVEKENLVHSDRYLEGVGVVKLLPGPVSSMLAVYLGLMVGGPLAGLLSVFCFILPSFLMLLGICYLELWAGPVLLSSNFFNSVMAGVQVTVLAVIAQTCLKLFNDSKKRSYAGQPRAHVAWIIALIAAAAALARVPELTILLLSGVLGFVFLKTLAYPRPSKLAVASWTLFYVFFKTGITVFGTGYMIIPHLQRIIVDQNHWLPSKTFLSAVAYGNLTPGPVLIAATHMGFQMNGLSGALAATMGIFIGPIILILIVGPHLNKIVGKPWVEGALMGILPAVSSTIFVGSIFLGRSLEWKPWMFGLLALSMVAAWKGIKPLHLLAAGAAVGLLVAAFGNLF